MKKTSGRRGVFESERRFRLLVEGVVDYAIYMLDPSGIIINWNAGAKRIKGYEADEVIGRHFQMFYPQEDREAGLPDRALNIAREKGKFEAEGWRVRKDGSKFLASIVVDALYEGGELIGFTKITRDVTEQNNSADALKESERPLRLLVNGVTDYAIYMLNPDGIIPTGMPGGSASKAIFRKKLSDSIFLASTRRRIRPPAVRRARSGSPWRTVAMMKRAGAFARMAPSFGQASSSIRYATMKAGFSASPRSPVTSPSGAKHSRISKKSSSSSPSRKSSTRWAS